MCAGERELRRWIEAVRGGRRTDLSFSGMMEGLNAGNVLDYGNAQELVGEMMRVGRIGKGIGGTRKQWRECQECQAHEEREAERTEEALERLCVSEEVLATGPRQTMSELMSRKRNEKDTGRKLCVRCGKETQHARKTEWEEVMGIVIGIGRQTDRTQVICDDIQLGGQTLTPVAALVHNGARGSAAHWITRKMVRRGEWVTCNDRMITQARDGVGTDATCVLYIRPESFLSSAGVEEEDEEREEEQETRERWVEVNAREKADAEGKIAAKRKTAEAERKRKEKRPGNEFTHGSVVYKQQGKKMRGEEEGKKDSSDKPARQGDGKWKGRRKGKKIPKVAMNEMEDTWRKEMEEEEDELLREPPYKIEEREEIHHGIREKKDNAVRIISWNVRGMGMGWKRTDLATLLTAADGDIICLQETKTRKEKEKNIKQGWMGRYDVVCTSAQLQEKQIAHGGVAVAIKRSLRGTVGKTWESVPGYVMGVEWKQGKRHMKIFNTYFPPPQKENEEIRRTIEEKIEEEVDKAREEGAEIALVGDLNAWDGMPEGLHDLAQQCGWGEVQTRKMVREVFFFCPNQRNGWRSRPPVGQETNARRQ